LASGNVASSREGPPGLVLVGAVERQQTFAGTVDELARLRSTPASELADIVAANLKRLVAT
jgi:hypothetical protein